MELKPIIGVHVDPPHCVICSLNHHVNERPGSRLGAYKGSKLKADSHHERWVGIGLRLMKTLTGGGRVVVHCRGCLVRSGIVVALLLIEAGMDSRDAVDAVDAVREARPGDIETIQQEAYVRGYRAMLPVDRAG